MAVIRVFEPALCCNTGVCGTDVDESLVRFTADLNAVKGEGVDVARANLATDPGAFAANPIAVAFVQTVGSAGLPLTVVDDVTVLTGVLVATAPQIWGFLVLIPYMGTAIGRLLSAWSAVVLWAVTAATFGIGRWPALALVAVSWLTMHLFSTLCAPWISRAMASLFERISGRPFWVSGADVLGGRPMLTTEVAA